MSDINIKETIEDKNSWYNIKRFSIQGLGQNFSQKTIDLSNTTKGLIENAKPLEGKRAIFEKSKKVAKFSEIKELINQSDDKKIKSYFGWARWLDNHFCVINFTFQFNPYDHVKNVEEISPFLTYLYEFSNNLICIPNIRTEKSILANDGKTTQDKLKIINIDEYLRFVDETYEFMSKKNHKHLFVPISLRFSIPELEKIIAHYIDKEYFYYWVDFEGKPLDPTQTARIRSMNRLISDKKYFEKVIFYFTNIKREIKSNIKELASPASDVLGTLIGGNIIGVDREPSKFFGAINDPSKKDLLAFEHKARTFDKESYYYKKTQTGELLKKPANITNNSLVLGQEFASQEQYFLSNLEIHNYLKTKEMLTSYRNGKILSELQREIVKKK